MRSLSPARTLLTRRMRIRENFIRRCRELLSLSLPIVARERFDMREYNVRLQSRVRIL